MVAIGSALIISACGRSGTEPPSSVDTAASSAAASSSSPVSSSAAPRPDVRVETASAPLLDPQRLEQYLPEAGGWTRGTPESGRLQSPILLSQTSAVYTKGAAHVTVKIIDGGGNQRLFSPFSPLMSGGSGTDTPDRSERPVSVDGYPAWEKWDGGTRNGEIGVEVNRRFLVQVEGRGVESIDVVRAIQDAVDIVGLAAAR